jgi:DNA end-binding protein Ku
MWKAALRLQGEEIPVRLYAAVHEHDIHFHLLHRADGVRVREHMVEKTDEQTVDSGEIRSGYALPSGDFVVLDKSDKEKLAPTASREIEVTQTVDLDALPLSAYLRPYWLGPDGDSTRYFALVHGLEKAKKQAIASWVMRGKHHFGALQARQGRLLLIDLRSADEWVDPKSLDLPAGRALDKRELDMAEQLVMALDGDFDHASFKDEYRDRVQALVDAKARGERPHKPKLERAKPAPASLSSALEASLRGLKGKSDSNGHAHATNGSKKPAAPGRSTAAKRAGHHQKTGKHSSDKERKSA